MLNPNNMTAAQREKLFERTIETMEDLIAQTAGLAGALYGFEGSAKAGVLPFDEAILGTCKDLFTRINDLLFLQKAKLEHHGLMDAVMETGEEQTRKTIEKARSFGPFKLVSHS